MSKAPRHPKPLIFHLAVGVAAVCVVAVALIIFRAMTAPPGASRSGGGNLAEGVTPEILGGQGGAEGLHIQVMDRDDPTRLSAELWSETIDPQAAQRYRVTEPRATLYLQDGRVAHLRSHSGTLVMPDQGRPPETGTLTDEVVVRVFDPHADGRAPDIDSDAPVFTWKGSSLTFDSTLGEASTDEPFELVSRDYVFRAKDAKMLINQTLERLERFAVRQGGTLIYTDHSADEPAAPPAEPGQDVPKRTAQGGGPAGGGTPGQRADASPARDQVVTFYQAVMRDGIRLSREGQEITSDRLDVFARTLDGKLPPDAIARFETTRAGGGEAQAGAAGGDKPADRPGGAPQPSGGAGGQRPADDEAAPENPGETILVWTGPLEVSPMSTEPAELADNHLLARFTSEESGVVSFADAESEASGRAAMVEYGFTEARLVLSGPSQGRSVRVKSPSMGEASMGRFELPLGEGREAGAVDAQVPGPFTVIGADGISRIDSGERARLRFAVRNGRLTGELLEAEFIGTAKASDADSWIEAERLLATFEPGESGRSELRRLLAEQSVRMDDGNGGSGRCDSLDTLFARGTDQPTPASFAATGSVSFRDQTGKIDSRYLRAELRENEGGSIDVARVWAEGEITLRRHTDQIDITGERLYADADEQYLEVEDAEGHARVSRGATVISGPVVRLSGSQRSAFVEGAGSFEHRAGRGEQASHVLASWTEGMAFSDPEGKLECLGSVEATHEPDVYTREKVSAELVRVELAPLGDAEAEAGEDQPLESIGEVDREIRSVYAAGRAYLGVGDELATIESARYAAPVNGVEVGEEGSEVEPELARAFRLSGVEILSDSLAGTLDVPGRGRMFVADLRPAPEGEEPDDDRGAALFDWRGSLHADRAAGTAEMLEGVSMSHARAADGTKTLLECARLRINFVPGVEEADELFGGLRSAIAETEVYLRTDAREMTADLLEYDPDAGIARALGDGVAGVRVLDRATGSPMTASAMIWNLTDDRVDIVDPSVITIPR